MKPSQVSFKPIFLPRNVSISTSSKPKKTTFLSIKAAVSDENDSTKPIQEQKPNNNLLLAILLGVGDEIVKGQITKQLEALFNLLWPLVLPKLKLFYQAYVSQGLKTMIARIAAIPVHPVVKGLLAIFGNVFICLMVGWGFAEARRKYIK